MISFEAEPQTIPALTQTAVTFLHIGINPLGVTTPDNEIFTVPAIGANDLYSITTIIRVDNDATTGFCNFDMEGAFGILGHQTFTLSGISPGGNDYYLQTTEPVQASAPDMVLQLSVFCDNAADMVIKSRRMLISYLGQWQ